MVIYITESTFDEFESLVDIRELNVDFWQPGSNYEIVPDCSDEADEAIDLSDLLQRFGFDDEGNNLSCEYE